MRDNFVELLRIVGDFPGYRVRNNVAHEFYVFLCRTMAIERTDSRKYSNARKHLLRIYLPRVLHEIFWNFKAPL